MQAAVASMLQIYALMPYNAASFLTLIMSNSTLIPSCCGFYSRTVYEIVHDLTVFQSDIRLLCGLVLSSGVVVILAATS